MADKLRITVLEPDPERARMIVDGLCDADDYAITVLGDETALNQRLKELNPDVVLVDIANPSRDTLESLSVASGANSRPVAMFVDRSDPEMTKAAIDAGLSAYVVDGLTKNRIKPVIDAAIARFHMVSQIRNERDAAKAALADRKTIDRAKGLLIAAKGISEDEAYSLLRTTAMNQGRKTADVANALIMASEMLK
ncbi:ANTAR domain-containing response regulator [Falsihalocynthiibacter sp. SS001]|uniref:ANTAR domain-containing response regulator n=1 Tax=Falsihalocynthiibacter sp. SS001 TaxID=3349698 RepID=UPI0036D32681